MNIDEIIDESSNYWSADDHCFRNVTSRDYVLFEPGGSYSNNWERIVAVFDEEPLRIGKRFQKRWHDGGKNHIIAMTIV